MVKDKCVFAGGVLVTPFRKIEADLVIEAGKIKEIRQTGIIMPGEEVIDCKDMYIGPGLCDIHVHGGAGADFASGDPDEILYGVKYHLKQGTTSITPSCISIPFESVEKAIAASITASKEVDASILGFHIEGIYFDEIFRGGHLEEYLKYPDPEDYEYLIRKYGYFLTEWTLAPELPGAVELIARCKEAGIITSAGHTQASYEIILESIEAGLTHSTHFACAMGNLRNEPLRESEGKGFAPGTMETILLNDALSTEVIADGFHLHGALMKLALKCKGPYRICLVSDAMKGAGMEDGEFIIGGQKSVVKGGIALIKGRPGVIASSVTPLAGMLRNACNNMDIPLKDAWTMASWTPASIIRKDMSKGSLAPGKDADILVLDRNLDVKYVYAAGKRVFP